MPIQPKNTPPYYEAESMPVERVEPKRWIGLMTQSGTNAPTASIVLNELGGTIVWTYISAGQYRGTLLNAFPSGKVIPKSFTIEFEDRKGWQVYENDDFITANSEVKLKTFDLGASSNDILNGGVYSLITIEVYP